MKKQKINQFLRTLSRILLGVVFIISGFVKAVDPLGTTYKIEDYLTVFGPFFGQFTGIALSLSFLLLTFEFLLGFNLLCNVHLRITSLATLLFMLFMTPLTLYIAIANPVSDCGCFGDALIISNWETFAKNIILLSLLAILLFSLRTYKPFFKKEYEWGMSVIGACSILILSLYCYRHLPILDFRPYKIGTHIESNMTIPENAELDQYETFFIYEKEGVEKEFTIENYPKEDSGWTFVAQKTTLLKKGYIPPIHDFNIINEEGDDITYDILEKKGFTFLLIAYDIKKSNLKNSEKINQIYDFAIHNEYSFYALTASLNEDIEVYCKTTKARYPWCKTDPITLKTMIRANPGLILIKNGVIIGKWNARDIPSPKEMYKTYFSEEHQ